MSPVTVEVWLARAAEALGGTGIAEPRLEARLLLGAAARWSAESCLSRRGESLAEPTLEQAEKLLARRLERQPMAQILGSREFWGLEFQVTSEVLDPRPDSETVVAAALALIGNRAAPLRVLDLGTGTGCLLLALLSELPAAAGLGVDASAAALRVAERNAKALGLRERTRFQIGDWAAGVEDSFEVILANPPYVPRAQIDGLQPEVARWEPRMALDGGEDGLDCYRRLAAELPGLLAGPGSFAAIEIGAGQSRQVTEIFKAAGLEVFERRRDLNGIDRCLLLRGGNRAPAAKKQLEIREVPSRVGAGVQSR